MCSKHETQQLFVRAVSQVKHGRVPLDDNALDVCHLSSSCAHICHLQTQTLTVFLGVILAKRYTNPSADIITVLAGLDEVDSVFFEFANVIESVIRTGRSGRCFRSYDCPWRVLRDYSGDPQQSYRCCSVIDFRRVSDKPRIILCPPRFISSFDKGMCICLALSMRSACHSLQFS